MRLPLADAGEKIWKEKVEGVEQQALGKTVYNQTLARDECADEKAEWVKAELQRMRSLYVMLSSHTQEIGRAVKGIQKRLKENQ
jgi:hypothetical protein